MRKEKDLEQLLEFLEKCIENEDVIKNPYEVCINCREVATLGEMLRSNHEGHTFVFQTIDHAGVDEWIKCLKWVLEK